MSSAWPELRSSRVADRGISPTKEDRSPFLLTAKRGTSTIDIERFHMWAEELYERYLGQVYRFSAMVADDREAAEALAQDIMLRALQALGRFDPQRGFMERLLWRIAVDAARDRKLIQKRRRLTFERLPSLGGREPDLAPELLAAIPDEEFLAAIHGLPRQARAVIALRFGAELDFATIADALKISASVASSTRSRALAKLHATLTRTYKESQASLESSDRVSEYK